MAGEVRFVIEVVGLLAERSYDFMNDDGTVRFRGEDNFLTLRPLINLWVSRHCRGSCRRKQEWLFMERRWALRKCASDGNAAVANGKETSADL